MDEESKVWIVVKAILRFIWVFLNNLYVIPAYLVWSFILSPLCIFAPKIYEKIDGILFKWTVGQVACWMWTAGYTLIEAGEDISQIHNDECLVLVNHLSTADVPTVFYGLLHHGTVMNNSLWVMDHMFKYTNFGVVSQRRGDFFIMQGKETRHLQGKLLQDHLFKVFWPRFRKWIFLFPEGGFLRKRLASSQKFAKKHGYPVLEHVTLPRIGAVEAILNQASPYAVKKNGICVPNGLVSTNFSYRPLKWIVDITIGYPDRRPLDLATICMGWRKSCDVTLHYRYFPVETVPRESEQLTKWLYDRWVEKEHMLQVYHSTGKFPSLEENVSVECGQNGESIKLDGGRRVVSSNLYFAWGHFFYLMSTALHCYLITQIFSIFIS